MDSEMLFEYLSDFIKNPKNFYKMNQYDIVGHGKSPTCGDDIKIYIKKENNKIKECSFHGSCCAICTCASSLSTEVVKNQTLSEACKKLNKIIEILTKGENASILKNHVNEEQLEIISVLQNIRKMPMRVKCGTLCPRAIIGAIEALEYNHNGSTSKQNN